MRGVLKIFCSKIFVFLSGEMNRTFKLETNWPWKLLVRKTLTLEMSSLAVHVHSAHQCRDLDTTKGRGAAGMIISPDSDLDLWSDPRNCRTVLTMLVDHSICVLHTIRSKFASFPSFRSWKKTSSWFYYIQFADSCCCVKSGLSNCIYIVTGHSHPLAKFWSLARHSSHEQLRIFYITSRTFL